MSSITKLKRRQSFDAKLINHCNPIVAIRHHGNGVVEVVRKSRYPNEIDFNADGRKDRKIMELTKRSLSKLIATVQATDIELNTMLTLTYPEIYPNNGVQVKKDLNRVLTRIRKAQELNYLWFLEFQKRGAPHLHILTDHGVITPRMRIDIAETWVGGMEKSEWFNDAIAEKALQCSKCEYDEKVRIMKKAYGVAWHRRSWEYIRNEGGARNYTTKYAAKSYQKEVPAMFADVGRFWGCCKAMQLDDGVEVEVNHQKFTEYLQSIDHATGKWDIVPKYLFNVAGV